MKLQEWLVQSREYLVEELKGVIISKTFHIEHKLILILPRTMFGDA
jgi:hypothetical protein